MATKKATKRPLGGGMLKGKKRRSLEEPTSAESRRLASIIEESVRRAGVDDAVVKEGDRFFDYEGGQSIVYAVETPRWTTHINVQDRPRQEPEFHIEMARKGSQGQRGTATLMDGGSEPFNSPTGVVVERYGAPYEELDNPDQRLGMLAFGAALMLERATEAFWASAGGWNVPKVFGKRDRYRQNPAKKSIRERVVGAARGLVGRALGAVAMTEADVRRIIRAVKTGATAANVSEDELQVRVVTPFDSGQRSNLKVLVSTPLWTFGLGLMKTKSGYRSAVATGDFDDWDDLFTKGRVEEGDAILDRAGELVEDISGESLRDLSPERRVEVLVTCVAFDQQHEKWTPLRGASEWGVEPVFGSRREYLQNPAVSQRRFLRR